MNHAEALAKLTQRQRDIIRLRRHEAKTWNEVGSELGISANYAAILLKRADEELEALMAGGSDFSMEIQPEEPKPKELPQSVAIEGVPIRSVDVHGIPVQSGDVEGVPRR